MKRSPGFSLIELVIAVGIFGILSILIFSFFRFGTRSFQAATNKQGLQLDALRAMESLQTELKRSNRASVTVLDGPSRTITAPVEGPVQRNGVSFLTLKNWQDKTNPNNFDLESQAPLWNRYLVFYATKDEIGQFIRVKADPNPAPEGAIEMVQDDLDLLLRDDPSLNNFAGGTPPYTILTKNVLEFSAEEGKDGLGKLTGDYKFSLKLKQKKAKGPVGPGPTRPFDYYEIEVVIKPENSYPNDL